MTADTPTKLLDSETKISPLKYPVARRDESVVETHHGVEIKDVYRWLEDPDSEETKKYVEEQNKISQPFLEGCDQWKKINEKFTKVWNYETYDCPLKHGKYYYFQRNTGLQNQHVLYRQESLTAEPELFFDPNALSSDGTIALVKKSFSEDGRYMGYGLSANGSDWFKIHIRDVETGKDLEEVLEKVKFSEISWTKDSKGFFYCSFPHQEGVTDGSETQSNENQKLYYHHLGQPQEKDVLIAEFPEEPTWQFQTVVSDCGKYLIMLITKDCRDNIVYYADLEPGKEINTKFEAKKIVEKFESDYEYITNIGSKMYFRTNKDASNYRVVMIDFENPALENWQTIIVEHPTDVLDAVHCVNENMLVLHYLHDAKSVLQVNSLESGEMLHKFDLEMGSVVEIKAKKHQTEFFYRFSSFLTPGIIYHYDFKWDNFTPKVLREIKLNLEGFTPAKYKVEQVFYESKDKTKIPMFIVYQNTQAGEKRTPRPCFLYGYGGFNCSMYPSFGVMDVMFLDTFDGVVAYPNLRGGGEYGEKWHNAGRLLNKQNVFDDFQAAAEYLIANNYTTKDRLVIQGGSNGGLLVAACINQRPDLFGAAVAEVGVMDMLRFHKFTIGHYWCSDYGNPDEKEHFENVLKYSPLHNVHTPTTEKEEYPATLVLTADHDDRVSPLHSLKFVAALQEAVRHSKYQKNPIFLRVYSNAGHGAGKPTSKIIEEVSDILTFMLRSLNIDKVNL
ncbi:prolyl endopeptidase-like [Musca vetustissima]|uniref:prolyl endopeptidase-like n=1 Tax=Musca vetustissima TaxID=27455 RepID=UPI002AB7A186|nr:prolyl endopeptidase-like [Musca vetustissima]